MKIFSKLYNASLSWMRDKYAIYWLSFISFIESFILPYPPPDVFLAPMAFVKPYKAYYFALVCTISSVLGGIVGYFIGSFLLDIAMPLLHEMNYIDKLKIIEIWFEQYGILIIAIAGFSPIPYKIFTIGAGMASMSLLPFILMSILARGLRFFLVAFFVRKFGDSCDAWLKKYIDYLGYGVSVLIILGVVYFKILA